GRRCRYHRSISAANRERVTLAADSHAMRSPVALALTLVVLAGCSSTTQGELQPDVEHAIERTLAAVTARFSTLTTLARPAGSAVRFSEATGIIDLQSATGDLRGRLTPYPFASPGLDPVS